MIGEIPAPGGALVHLGHRRGEGLAHLQGRQPGQLVGLILQDLPGAAQQGCALRERRPPVLAERLRGAGQLAIQFLAGESIE